MQLVVGFGLIVFIGWVVWSICRSRFTFEVRVKDGVPELVRGDVANSFLQEIAEVCTRHGVRDGVVRGVSRGERIALSFSGDLPAPCQQQLRNIWNLAPRMSAFSARRSRS
jgi:hypothetical protein